MNSTGYITDADYADDLTLLANTTAQAKSLLHSLKQAAIGIGLYINTHSSEFMGSNQEDAISLNGKLFEVIEQSIYLGSNISSTESYVNICIGKA